MFRRHLGRIIQLMGYNISRKCVTPSQTENGECVSNSWLWPVELDAADRELASRIMESQLTMVSAQRLCTTLLACKYVVEASIEGDFVECGVWKGGLCILAARMFQRCVTRKQVWCFDTFRGMTEPSDFDCYSENSIPAKSEFFAQEKEAYNAWCYSSLDEVKDNLRAFGVSMDNLMFVEGDVCQTLLNERNIPAKISVLRLDTDWYESTRKELEVLYPRLSRGGVLIIDDYGYWSGARKAVDDYFKTHGNRPFLQVTDRDGRAAVKVV